MENIKGYAKLIKKKEPIDKVLIYKRQTIDSAFHIKGDLVVFIHRKFFNWESYIKFPSLIEGAVYEVDYEDDRGLKLIGEKEQIDRHFLGTESKLMLNAGYKPTYIFDNRGFFVVNQNVNLKP